MLTITLADMHYPCQANETVLDTLLKADIPIPNGCREGACQSCLMRSLDIAPPASAQKGLKNTLQHQNYFLACQCLPVQDMTVAMPDYEGLGITAKVSIKQSLSADIMRLVLAFAGDFTFRAGQFVNLKRQDGLTRSYSIANAPTVDKALEFHIKRLPNGRFSAWVHDELAIGDELKVSEAKGTCHYLPGNAAQPMLLVGTGSGLAPLIGIVNDALGNGHSGPIQLYHGSRDPEGLYLIDEIQSLAETHANFSYTPCISGDKSGLPFTKGRAHEVALSSTESLTGWRVYLCGHPEMVNQSKMMAYLKGASLNDIYADAFYTSAAGR